MDKEQEKKLKLEMLQELQSVMGKHAVSSIFPKAPKVPEVECEDMSDDVMDDEEEDEDEGDTDVSRLRKLLSKGK